MYGCPFQVPEAFQNLIDQVDETLKHALEEEEKVPISDVLNFTEVVLFSIAWGYYNVALITHMSGIDCNNIASWPSCQTLQNVPVKKQQSMCQKPHAGSGVVRIDLLRFLAGCRTRR